VASLALFTAARPEVASGGEAKQAAPLARYFPREDLVVYAEFDGLDARPDVWRKSAAYRLLNETTTGSMLEDVARQLLDRALASAPGPRLSGAEVLTVFEHVSRSGFAFGIVRNPSEPKPSCIGLVLRGAAGGKVRETLGKLLQVGDGPGGKSQVVAKPGGRWVNVAGGPRAPGYAWWTEGDDLVVSLVAPQGVDVMIGVLDGNRANAADHPIRAALARVEDGFSPLGLAYFDKKALPALPPPAVALGLDRLERLEYRWGFQGEALHTVVRLVAPAPRSMLLSLLDQPTFDQRGLLPLPRSLAGFSALSIDLAVLFDGLGALTASNDPRGRDSFGAFAKAFERATGHRLREDVLAQLGPRIVAYSVPTKVNAPTNPLAGLALGFAHTPKTAIVVEVKNADAFSRTFGDLIRTAQGFSNAQADARPGAPAVRFNPVKGVERGFVLSVPPSVSPLPAGLRPTFVLGKKTLVIGSTPEAAREALALEARTGGLPAGDPLAEALARAPEKLTFLNVSDTRQSLLPEVLANLPGLVQLVGTAATSGVRPRFAPGRGPRPFGPGAFQLNIDPEQIPSPDDLRPFLFPGIMGFTADEQGFQFVSHESFPTLNPAAVAPVAVALLLPAVQASRSAARRAQSTNNLKQIGLALHNFHSANNHFPPQAITDKSGKPLLSWRVAILPFIDQQGVFNEFKLDEPWDSPNNKALLERMPMTYAVPGADAEPGMTFYRGFSGAHTLFDPNVKDGLSLASVTDGTSNTLGIVEAREAVPWTKPDEEIPFDFSAKSEKASELVPMLGAHFPGGFNAVFLDGSVRFIKHSISPVVLRALITRDGGEVISSDSF
jgi:hypothetical protein